MPAGLFMLERIGHLNFMIAPHKARAVDVLESDYSKLATLRDAVDYVAQRITV